VLPFFKKNGLKQVEAIALPENLIEEARISIGKFTTDQDIELAESTLERAVYQLRQVFTESS
jgi:cysteine sulfinate desulfinase/cysteine desulfurase-like protein